MNAKKRLVIAIDGPAGSGKSTTARLTAEKLSYIHLDTGAMYRTVTLNALEHNISMDDPEKVAVIAAVTEIRFEHSPECQQVYMNNINVTEKIRTPEITNKVAKVAANPVVRQILVDKQRSYGLQGGIVAEGRDVGTVVYPNADLKVYMDASAQERAKRRYKELTAKGIAVNLSDILQDIEKRDTQDTQREINPLRQAVDAVLVDTSDMNIDQQVEFVVKLARERGA